MTATIPFAFLETICICCEKFNSLSIMIPKSLSRCVLCTLMSFPSYCVIVQSNTSNEYGNTGTLISHLIYVINIRQIFVIHVDITFPVSGINQQVHRIHDKRSLSNNGYVETFCNMTDKNCFPHQYTVQWRNE